MHRDIKTAEFMANRLWLLALQAKGPEIGPWAHIKSAFKPEWLATLGLPIDSERGSYQTVALVEGESFTRSSVDAEVAVAYSNRPRTQLYESVGARSGSWFAAVDLLLTKQFRFEVTSDIYVSNVGDATMGPHRDEWYGLIVQLSGAKEWTIWDSQGSPTTFTVEAGDVLLLPRGVWHNVATPDHSVHVVFAVMTDEPIAALLTA